ncbi:hypothetical protein PENTCL1PPCAC_21708, partial [Pristionchus entomophagus]
LMANVLRDIRTISQFDHPGIVRCYTTWIETPPEGWQNIHYQDFIYIQLQWCEYSLEAWLEQNQTISSRSHERIFSWFKQMVSAVSYIHKKSLIHGNLKPSNILFVEEDRLKISDIDVMEEFEVDKTSKIKLYMSPERYKSLPYSSKTDIFSLGLIFAQLSVVVRMDMVEQIFDKCRDGHHINIRDHATEKLVACLTHQNVADRPECKDILELQCFKTNTTKDICSLCNKIKERLMYCRNPEENSKPLAETGTSVHCMCADCIKLLFVRESKGYMPGIVNRLSKTEEPILKIAELSAAIQRISITDLIRGKEGTPSSPITPPSNYLSSPNLPTEEQDGREYATVTFDYAAQNCDKLSLKVGQTVRVVNKMTADSGWYEG